MTKRQYLKLLRIQIELDDLRSKIELTNRDCELKYGNGLESVQLGCASAALETILQEVEL